jgi:hypothetical protein
MVEVLERPATKQPVIFDLPRPSVPIPEQPLFTVAISKTTDNYAGIYRGNSRGEAMARAWLAIEYQLVESEMTNASLAWDHFIIREGQDEPTKPNLFATFPDYDGTGIHVKNYTDGRHTFLHQIIPLQKYKNADR